MVFVGQLEIRFHHGHPALPQTDWKKSPWLTILVRGSSWALLVALKLHSTQTLNKYRVSVYVNSPYIPTQDRAFEPDCDQHEYTMLIALHNPVQRIMCHRFSPLFMRRGKVHWPLLIPFLDCSHVKMCFLFSASTGGFLAVKCHWFYWCVRAHTCGEDHSSVANRRTAWNCWGTIIPSCLYIRAHVTQMPFSLLAEVRRRLT